MYTRLATAFLCLVLLGCRRGEPPVEISVPRLAYADAESLDRILGAPIEVSHTGGEYPEARLYGLSRGLLVELRAGRAERFVMGLPNPTPDAAVAMRSVGLDPKRAPEPSVTQGATAWRGRLNGVACERAMVYRVPEGRATFNMAAITLVPR